MNARDLWGLGAEPIDITAATLLWKSPWWAKALESMQDIPVNERTFMRALGILYRDCRRRGQEEAGGLQEFCDLATIARKVRWRFPNDRPGFGQKYLGRLKRKLSCLEWNASICRFELKPFRPRQPRKARHLRKEPAFREQRKAVNLQREIEVSNLIAKAIQD